MPHLPQLLPLLPRLCRVRLGLGLARGRAVALFFECFKCSAAVGLGGYRGGDEMDTEGGRRWIPRGRFGCRVVLESSECRAAVWLGGGREGEGERGREEWGDGVEREMGRRR